VLFLNIFTKIKLLIINRNLIDIFVVVLLLKYIHLNTSIYILIHHLKYIHLIHLLHLKPFIEAFARLRIGYFATCSRNLESNKICYAHIDCFIQSEREFSMKRYH